jgi:hypothetical protein
MLAQMGCVYVVRKYLCSFYMSHVHIITTIHTLYL